jgi:AraC-like DNA-binding protein
MTEHVVAGLAHAYGADREVATFLCSWIFAFYVQWGNVKMGTLNDQNETAGAKTQRTEIQMQSGAGEIPDIRYSNRDRPKLQVEALTLSDLVRRVPPDHFDRPQRPEFHLLILCLEGSGAHWVDFVRYDWTPQTILHVRPGQVQQFALEPSMEAQILLFAPAFLASERNTSEQTACSRLIWRTRPATVLRPGQSAHWRIAESFRVLVEEYHETDGSALSVRVLQLQLQTLILQLVRISDQAAAMPAIPDVAHRTYFRFIEELEEKYAKTRCVEDYAATLGYTSRTLSRACLLVGHATPKKLIESRVALEAKRLLAHTELSVKAIAQEVGFGEDTNFIKFFRRVEGVLPTVFRAQHRIN